MAPTTPPTPKATPDTSKPSPHTLSNPLTNTTQSGEPAQDTRGYAASPALSQNAQTQQPYGYDPNNPQQQLGYQGAQDPNAPFDPNAPDGERGLGTALAGGAAGYYMGHKAGNHGFLGAVGGAILGNFLGDEVKKHKEHGGQHGGHHGGGSSSGGSSWGGGGGRW